MMNLSVRNLKRLALALVLLTVSAALVSAEAKQESRGGGDGKGEEVPYGLNYIPLRSDNVDIAVRSVVLLHRGKTYLLEARERLEVESQDKLPLSKIPLLGQLTAPTYTKSDFSDDARVGDVVANDERLIVNLPEVVQLPGGVVVFNHGNAFIIGGKPAPTLSDIPFVGEVVGGAFKHGEKNQLLIMVRPSIILDGELF